LFDFRTKNKYQQENDLSKGPKTKILTLKKYNQFL